jgi:mRNA-degrading endonuclease RelE of RelBE toxin-antitoxin system
MNSRAEPSFWKQYRQLPPDIRSKARKAYRLWQLNPNHPSLAFKRLNTSVPLYSARISLSHRVVARL